MRYGLIPEFIGRMPVSAVLEPLDAHALESILTEPRDALVKQFKTLLSMDNVQLDFENDVIGPATVTHDGQVTNERVRDALEGNAS